MKDFLTFTSGYEDLKEFPVVERHRESDLKGASSLDWKNLPKNAYLASILHLEPEVIFRDLRHKERLW